MREMDTVSIYRKDMLCNIGTSILISMEDVLYFLFRYLGNKDLCTLGMSCKWMQSLTVSERANRKGPVSRETRYMSEEFKVKFIQMALEEFRSALNEPSLLKSEPLLKRRMRQALAFCRELDVANKSQCCRSLAFLTGNKGWEKVLPIRTPYRKSGKKALALLLKNFSLKHI
jgi:hypothetical protein